MDIKIGDRIAYIQYNPFNCINKVGIGTVFCKYEKDGVIGVSSYNKSTDRIVPNYLYLNNNDKFVEEQFKINENTKEEMKSYVQDKIKIFESEIKKLTSEEKDEIKRNEFDRIKNQIISTANNMINGDENDFINKLKEICRLKTQLFTIKISDIDNIHKKNGAIKYKIKELKKLLDDVNKIEF